ncbi:MAG: hydroxyacid dehydrogenase, partial [Acidobacteria bacterium]|nr:hydroxyacid dehydrogenase [Acidobacteriota bacterium]
PATHALVVRHRDRPGVLAAVLDHIRAAEINVQEMENIIFEGSEAAVARINLEAAPAPETLERLKAENSDIIELSLLEIQKP